MEDRTLTTPYDGTQKLLALAWRKGHAARVARTPFRCPLSNYVRSAVRAWEEGWRAADAELERERIARVEKRVPDVRVQRPPLETR